MLKGMPRASRICITYVVGDKLATELWCFEVHSIFNCQKKRHSHNFQNLVSTLNHFKFDGGRPGPHSPKLLSANRYPEDPFDWLCSHFQRIPLLYVEVNQTIKAW